MALLELQILTTFFQKEKYIVSKFWIFPKNKEAYPPQQSIAGFLISFYAQAFSLLLESDDTASIQSFLVCQFHSKPN